MTPPPNWHPLPQRGKVALKGPSHPWVGNGKTWARAPTKERGKGAINKNKREGLDPFKGAVWKGHCQLWSKKRDRRGNAKIDRGNNLKD